jgi:UDP-N-acetylglucosamine diphosphorylase/glucosamine-1-phosphate N-acetyltransferase
MDILLFDPASIRKHILPFTFTRPVSEIRLGILTIAEKWKIMLDGDIHYHSHPSLTPKFPNHFSKGLIINGSICPDEKLLEKIKNLEWNQSLYNENELIACKVEAPVVPSDIEKNEAISKLGYDQPITQIKSPWDIFLKNAAQIRYDFQYLTANRTSAPITDTHTIIYGNRDQLFLEAGASVRAAIINVENGPVYIGKNAQVHEGAIIRGSFALLDGSHVNPGTKIRGDSTIGPVSKVGGEISNSVIMGYSNKAHDAFLGNSVIGEWCNLGADTNTSNLKNNYDEVKLWSYAEHKFIRTGQQFCGLMMADHAKCGINTMFNTGTVVGVGSNVFGSGFPRNFIPSFSWGGSNGLTTFQFSKFLQTAEKVMARRDKVLDSSDKQILETIFEQEQSNRFWEK